MDEGRQCRAIEAVSTRKASQIRGELVVEVVECGCGGVLIELCRGQRLCSRAVSRDYTLCAAGNRPAGGGVGVAG